MDSDKSCLRSSGRSTRTEADLPLPSSQIRRLQRMLAQGFVYAFNLLLFPPFFLLTLSFTTAQRRRILKTSSARSSAAEARSRPCRVGRKWRRMIEWVLVSRGAGATLFCT